VDLALQHLWSLGHRRIGHLAGPAEGGPAADWRTVIDDIAIRRLEAYRAWMQTRIAGDPALIAHARAWEATRVPEIVTTWAALPQRPTAVFCANDALAVGVIEAARQRGWRVPEELSVVGVDNSGVAAEVQNSLTSIDIPMEAVGREGTRALLQVMQGAPLEACRIALPVPEIVVRGSTARMPRDGQVA
jgi:LacI family transcriptional regulator